MRAILLLCLLVAVHAHGEEDAERSEIKGYIESRLQLTRARVRGLLPTQDLAQLHALLEVNGQVRHRYSAGGFVDADVSLFFQAAGMYRQLDANDNEVAAAVRDVPAYRPLVSLSELYLSHDLRDDFNLLVGKKRIVWGSGIAFNPTDLINPPKDPTDPAYQRAGAFLARAELIQERFALSLLFAPQVTEQSSGLPHRFLRYPAWDAQDDQRHYLLGARLYSLVADSDLNLMLFWSNRYNDAFERKLRAGFSFSRYFFTDYELHVEALLQQGSTRFFVNGPCVIDAAAAFGCVASREPIVAQSRLLERTLYPQLLLGTRYQFDDESLLSLEYLYQSDGFSRSEFQDLVNGLQLVKNASRMGIEVGDQNPFFTSTAQGIPQKFFFQPLSRHYAVLAFQKPKIRDDFTLAATVVANLQDFSALVSPSLFWSLKEWLLLGVTGFVPTPPLHAQAAVIPGTSSRVGEYTLLPMRYRAVFQARLFY